MHLAATRRLGYRDTTVILLERDYSLETLNPKIIIVFLIVPTIPRGIIKTIRNNHMSSLPNILDYSLSFFPNWCGVLLDEPGPEPEHIIWTPKIFCEVNYGWNMKVSWIHWVIQFEFLLNWEGRIIIQIKAFRSDHDWVYALWLNICTNSRDQQGRFHIQIPHLSGICCHHNARNYNKKIFFPFSAIQKRRFKTLGMQTERKNLVLFRKSIAISTSISKALRLMTSYLFPGSCIWCISCTVLVVGYIWKNQINLNSARYTLSHSAPNSTVILSLSFLLSFVWGDSSETIIRIFFFRSKLEIETTFEH